MAAAQGRSIDIPSVGDYWEQPENSRHHLYCVYKFRNADNECIYVGQTSDLVRRIRQHHFGNAGNDTKAKPWWPEVSWIEVEHFDPGTTLREVEVYERLQIEALRPRYNIEHNPTYGRGDQKKAEKEMAQRRQEAKALYERHNGYTRLVMPRVAPYRIVAGGSVPDRANQVSVGSLIHPVFLVIALVLGMILGMVLALVA